ncbi:MAG: site-specific integrase [Candidatus Shapirobacteria bacterium]|nr:site-specific integrase [Candidatus Shapirobacteria bacterium]MDD5074005.1 site-specific integrase [Candidatus Shapirobacteria bacterium]MDD5481454.1 site-specific integrase [Candidatus Shapirobacteria bacterium]
MNFQDIVRPFSLYLKSQKVSENTLRNYLADTRHFFSWLSKNYSGLASSKPNIIAQNISTDIFRNYKRFLKNNRVPHSTINRRLSTLRKLSSFFVSQGWRQNNLGKKVANITSKKETSFYWQALNRFAKTLKTEGKSESTIRNYLSDIRGFLTFLSKDEKSPKKIGSV